jgi:hypothetical protein
MGATGWKGRVVGKLMVRGNPGVLSKDVNLSTATNKRAADHVLTLSSPAPFIHPLPLRQTMWH